MSNTMLRPYSHKLRATEWSSWSNGKAPWVVGRSTEELEVQILHWARLFTVNKGNVALGPMNICQHRKTEHWRNALLYFSTADEAQVHGWYDHRLQMLLNAGLGSTAKRNLDVLRHDTWALGFMIHRKALGYSHPQQRLL